MKSLKIILVDDNATFRKALKTVLVQQFHVEIIGEAANADEFMNLLNLQQADIILMDVMMPGVDGITLTKNTLRVYNKLKIIAITMHYEQVYLLTLIEAGFVGCIFKNDIFNNVFEALETVSNGKLFFPKDIHLQDTI